MKVLEVENVSHHFETDEGNVSVLTDIDLAVEKDEFLSIIGPSGCGKSTLLRIFAGLIKPSSGHVFLNEQALTRTNSQISFIFQNFADTDLRNWTKFIVNNYNIVKIIGKIVGIL